MADLPSFIGTVDGDWEATVIPVGTWLWQNRGATDVQIAVTDGTPPADEKQGEYLERSNWTPYPVLVGAGEAVFVRGRDVVLFYRATA